MRDNIDVTIEVIACNMSPHLSGQAQGNLRTDPMESIETFIVTISLFFYNLKCTLSDLLADH